MFETLKRLSGRRLPRKARLVIRLPEKMELTGEEKKLLQGILQAIKVLPTEALTSSRSIDDCIQQGEWVLDFSDMERNKVECRNRAVLSPSLAQLMKSTSLKRDLWEQLKGLPG